MNYLKDIFVNPHKYVKFWVAFATFGLNVLAVTFPTAQWLPALISLAGAFGVFYYPNNKSK